MGTFVSKFFLGLVTFKELSNTSFTILAILIGKSMFPAARTECCRLGNLFI